MVKTLVGGSFLTLFSEYVWYNRVPFIISTIVTAIIFIFHCTRLCLIYYEYRQSKVQLRIDDSSPHSKTGSRSGSPRSQTERTTGTNDFENQINCMSILNHVTIILIMAFTLIHHIHGLLGIFPFLYWRFGAMIHCGIWPNLQAIWYHCANCLIYNIFVLRIKITFAESAYEYKNSTLYTLLIGINLYWLYTIFGDYTEIYGSWEYIPFEHSLWCQMHLAIFGVVLSGGIDTVISGICMILFIKPLLKVLQHSGGTESQIFEEVVIRYFILSFTAIGSTSLWALLTLFCDVGGLSSIDLTINLICVIMMSNIYKKYYLVLCKPCHSFVANCQSKSIQQDKNICRI